MASLDASTLGQKVIRFGLVTPAQLEECRDEADSDGETLLRALERKGYLTGLQIEKLRKGDIDGYLLGGFRLLYKIASGSFGRVFRADDPRSGRIVAIKVLRRRWSEDPANVELFEREGRLGMTLRHPNIVEILQIGRDPATNAYFIVMEFVEGANLRDVLAIRKRLEPTEALRFLEDTASALAAASAKGMTHRDIKLTNILISTQGVAKLVDFGLAKMIWRSGPTPDEEGHVQRTVDYAGLEKATGVQAGDPRSDIFFLGCVLFEMLTGRPPMVTTRDKFARMRRDRFENIAALRPDEVGGHAGVVRLCERMMSVQPQYRIQTPSQLLEAIKQTRTELGGNGAEPKTSSTAPTVFVVESNERLQEIIREKLKKDGYRVLIAATPARAIERFTQHPFQALVVDAGTTGEEGCDALRRVLAQAKRRGIACRGILLLAEKHKEWADALLGDPELDRGAVSVLAQPLKLGDLVGALRESVPVPKQAPA